MNCLGKIAVCLAGGLMLNISAHADDAVASSNPYVPIVVRNVFGLNPPPTNAPPSADDTPLKITPNGIMSIFGQLQVLFKVAPRAGQPGAKEASYCLSEGQSQDDIEVTHINEKDSIVTFNNHGTVQDIPLANAPALNMPMPAPAAPGQNFPAPAGVPTRFGGHFGGGPAIPAAPGGSFGGNNPNAGNGPGNTPAMSAAPMGASGGGYANPTTAQQNANTQQSANSGMTAEEQQLLVVAQHLKAQQEGSPTAPIFPPTPLDEQAGLPPMPGSTTQRSR